MGKIPEELRQQIEDEVRQQLQQQPPGPNTLIGPPPGGWHGELAELAAREAKKIGKLLEELRASLPT